MVRRDRFQSLALAALLTLPLATAACSKGSSPTEPAALDLDATSSDDSFVSTSDDSRGRGRGGNDTADDRGRRGRRGRGDDRQDDNRQPRAPRAGQEFEGAVAAVGGSSLTLAGGTVVLIDGQTQWNGRGDLFSLAEIAASLGAGNAPRVEGRGPRQADGSILARTIKAEHLGD